jgi:hypothetical protein
MKSLFLIIGILSTLAGCNPAKTKLGENFFASIEMSYSKSLLTASQSQVATSNSVDLVLKLRDQNGAAYISSKPKVTFSKSGGTSVGTLSGVSNLGNGIYTATFTGVTPGTATTIHAQVDGQEVTSVLPTIQVTTGNFSLSKSAITVSATSVTSSSSVTVTLTAKDASDTQLPDGGLSVIFSNTGGTSTGVWSAVTDNLDGTYTATFTGLTAGTATSLTATIGGSAITSANPTVTVNVGAATKLSFIQGPTATASGSVISPNVTVEALDVNNNRVTSYGSDIVLGIHTNPSGGTLSGTLTKTPVSGVSSFNNLAINYYGNGYRLTATSGALTAALSSAFNISATAITYDLPFTSITDPIYTTLYTSSSWSNMQFEGDLVRLTPTGQTDTAATAGTMDSPVSSVGVALGTLADGVSLGLKLGSGGGCNGANTDCAKQTSAEIYELNSSWTPQWTSLVSYWKMNTNWNDSIGTANGTAFGASLSSNAKIGAQAGQFDGVNNYVNFGDVNYSAGTIAFWYKTTGSSDYLISKVKAGGNYAGEFRIYMSSGKVAWEIDEPTARTITANAATNDNNWHHFVGVYNPGMKMYIDGVLQTNTNTGNVTGMTVAGENLNLGRNNALQNSHLAGSLDELAIWSTQLSAQDVTYLYERQSSKYSGTFTSRVMDAKSSSTWTTLSWATTLPFLKALPDNGASESSANYTSIVENLMNGIVGVWHFDEVAGTTGVGSIKDTSGNNHHGTPGTGVFTGQSGVFQKSVSLSGGGARIISVNSTPGSLSTGQTATISMWLNWDGVNADMPFGFHMYDLIFYNGCLGFNTGNGDCFGATVTPSNLSKKWIHLVAEFRTGSVVNNKLYINGVAQTLSQILGTPSLGSAIVADLFNFGSWGVSGSNRFNGLIDEVAIWNRILSTTEVRQLYQRGASRVKYQVRSCNDNGCSGESWQGPDGTSGTYFSELNNTTSPLAGTGDVKPTLPSMLFSHFSSPVGNNQYFQYRAIFESDSATPALQPELKSVSVDPIHYDSSSPSIYGNNGVAFSELSAFVENLGSGGCASGVGYNLSLDKSLWKYWNGSNWVTSNDTAAQSNTATVIHTNAATFGAQVGKGTVYVKAYLKSTGTSKCELDNIQLGGNR